VALLSVTLYVSCFIFASEIIVEAKRAVRAGRGQGGHAYQLEKALNPITGEHVRKANEGIPEDVPENAMAPQALNKAQPGKKAVINFRVLSLLIVNFLVFARSKTQI
jgi:hypothetical protein